MKEHVNSLVGIVSHSANLGQQLMDETEYIYIVMGFGGVIMATIIKFVQHQNKTKAYLELPCSLGLFLLSSRYTTGAR